MDGLWVLVTMDGTIVDEHPRFEWHAYAIAWIVIGSHLGGVQVEQAKATSCSATPTRWSIRGSATITPIRSDRGTDTRVFSSPHEAADAERSGFEWAPMGFRLRAV